MESEYKMPETGEFYVTPEIRADFDKNGFILVRGLFNAEEAAKMKACAEQSNDIKKYAYGRSDSHGRTSKMCLWNYAGNDVFGMVARCRKVAGTIQELMGGDEIYHYHTKLMMKEPRTGGAWNWHQDYGYWYQNGCLLPEMASIFMPVDPCTRENGCLAVLRGSHKMGRIDHVQMGEQAGVEPGRLEDAKKVFEMVYVEMQPGDALFFHANLLHSRDSWNFFSQKNDSDLRRWALVMGVNKRKNQPTREHHHPLYHDMRIVPNSAVLDCPRFDSTEEKWFMDPNEEKSYEVGKGK